MLEETVLVVEDDAVLRRGLTDNFEMRGYRVLAAEDGEVGLEQALTHTPDLIVLDIMMPRMNGFEVCRLVREAGLDMPILMLTAKGQEADIVRGLNLGADDYITKPFSIRELLARCSAFLRRRRSAEPETFTFADCTLDLRSHRLFRAGKEIALAPKEFRLIELFVRRAGRALTRDEILRAVWGRDILVTTRSVDRCIATLRGKIEDDPRRPQLIQTIRDVGYRFEAADPEETQAQPTAVTERPLPAGTRLGPYEILTLIGRGGMGEVYRARDARLARDVAVKVLAPQLADHPQALDRFTQETRAIAALSHPGILAIYDVGREAQLTYAVMELLEGETLRQRLDAGPLAWPRAVAITRALADGLAAAHAKEIVHRDLKPSNIFLTQDAIKILDFGLARIDAPPGELPDDSTTLTRHTAPGAVLGTAGYLAPEQLRGQGCDARSDLFSLGCVLFEMLTGAGPFAAPTAADSLASVLAGAVDFDRLPESAPGELRRILIHLLEADPERRFQSTRDLLFALGGVDDAAAC